jgi:glycoside/pentoside/hexuronide:cation symporter, GPH family
MHPAVLPPTPPAAAHATSVSEGATAASASHSPWQGGWSQGLRYGALGLPLAFVALPLYVVLPNHYATAFGVPLATLGALLLGARLFDAVTDPLIGRWLDHGFARSNAQVLLVLALAAGVLALGFRGLFFPAVATDGSAPAALLWWCGALLAVTYLAYSVLAIGHQSWGARLGGDAGQRARIVSWREAAALLGVLVASVLPAVAGLSVATTVFAVLLALGVALLFGAPKPMVGVATTAVSTLPGVAGSTSAAPLTTAAVVGIPAAAAAVPRSSLRLPLRTPAFRRLLAIYLVNGIASAIPATLVLFFIRDRLQAQAFEPLFLASYFAAGALSMPLWIRAVSRFGLARTWAAGMVLAVVTFAWAALLGAGDVAAYTAVCIASGVALGADLVLPGALLAGVIQRAGHGQQLEGGYFGWWNFATKLNLALAAGIALPALALFGYTPGSRDPAALQALTLAYCLLPCVLKLLALALLRGLWMRTEKE